MNNCLVFYSNYSGPGNHLKKINLIKKTLLTKFEKVDLKETFSIDEFSKSLIHYSSLYNTYVICGGDGTLNIAINSLMKCEIKPTIGYINLGSLGDAGKNFGVTKNVKKALRIILNNNVKKIDICEISGHYFLYMASNGAFSDIASSSHRRLGKLSYYLHAIPKVLKKESHNFSVKINNKLNSFDSSFLMFLNGKKVGGFNINKHSLIDDGLCEMFYSKSTFLNGIPSYILKTKKIVNLKVNNVLINTKLEEWCLDGEKYKISNPIFKMHGNCIDFYVE